MFYKLLLQCILGLGRTGVLCNANALGGGEFGPSYIRYPACNPQFNTSFPFSFTSSLQWYQETAFPVT